MRTTPYAVLVLSFAAACGGPADVVLAKPEHGFQLEIEKAAIAQGEEWQACFFFQVPDLDAGKPFFVNRITMAQNVGSHHLNVFRQGTVLAPDPMNPSVGLRGPNADGTGSVVSRDGTGPCFYSANWADWPLVVNDQEAAIDDQGVQKNYVLDLAASGGGDNIAYKFTPGEMLMLQSHFVNASTQKTPTRAYAVVNFERNMNPDNVQEVGTLFATKQSISICRNDPTPSFSGFCKLQSARPITVIAANGHFHSRGKTFLMNTWDGKSVDPKEGQQFYESLLWDEPPMATGLRLALPSGGGVSWTCSYKWAPSPSCTDGCSCIKPPKNPQGECCYGFGGVVETSEHCNAFVYYYPKLERGDINCL